MSIENILAIDWSVLRVGSLTQSRPTRGHKSLPVRRVTGLRNSGTICKWRTVPSYTTLGDQRPAVSRRHAFRNFRFSRSIARWYRKRHEETEDLFYDKILVQIAEWKYITWMTNAQDASFSDGPEGEKIKCTKTEIFLSTVDIADFFLWPSKRVAVKLFFSAGWKYSRIRHWDAPRIRLIWIKENLWATKRFFSIC